MEDDAFRLRTRSLAPERRASNAPQSDHTRDPAGEEFLFHLFRGSELLQDSRVHEAKEELEQALLLQPRDPKGQDLLAVVYFRIGHYPRAIQIYEQLKRDNPDSPSLRLNLALCYLKTGQAQLAREELEEVVRVQPDHRRAWGYLGLAYERLTDYDKAELAFERGGHGAMARRMAQRRQRPSLFAGAPSTNLPSLLAPAVDDTHVRPTEGMTHEEESRVGEARAAAAEAFQELDSGELSFALARPATQHPNGEASLAPDASGGTGAPSGVERWHAVEIGEAVKTERPPASTRGAALAPPSNPPPQPAGPSRPPPEAESPPVSAASPMSTATVQSLGSVAASVLSSVRPVTPIQPSSDSADVPSTADLIAALAPSPRDDERPLSLDRAGLLTLRLKTGAGTHDFAVRFDGLKSYTGTLAASVLERRGRSGPNGETFGGVAGAVMHVSGDGAVVVGPRPGRAAAACLLRAGEVLFLREDALLAFDLAMSFESGRIARGDDEPVAVVQVRGPGALAFEHPEPLRAIEVTPTRRATARAAAVLGWLGRLMPSAVPLGEAPGGQRGLVEFTGEGTLFVAGR